METPKLALLGFLGTASGNWSHHVLDGLCKIGCATQSVLKEATGLCGVLGDMPEMCSKRHSFSDTSMDL